MQALGTLYVNAADTATPPELWDSRGQPLGAGLHGLETPEDEQHVRDSVQAYADTPNIPVSPDQIRDALGSEQVQQMASRAGTSLTSTETIPAETAGGYRRIAIRVAFKAPWPVLVELLQSIEDATPRMLVDDLTLQAAPILGRQQSPLLDSTFTVVAFCQCQAPAQERAP